MGARACHGCWVRGVEEGEGAATRLSMVLHASRLFTAVREWICPLEPWTERPVGHRIPDYDVFVQIPL